MNLVAVAGLLAVQAVPAVPAPQQARDTAPAPTITFVQPPFEIPSALRDSIRFGWLDVPQDHDDAGAASLRLALSILPARTTPAARDPIVFIPGGPGMSTVAPWTVEALRSPRIALLREHRDFIIVDPRGHGLSQPQTCPELNAAAPLASDSADAESALARLLEDCRARLERDGVRLATLSAIQASHDIELLRRALGLTQINLFGASYGTRIVAEAARQHPTSIRSIVFLSPVPPHIGHLGDDATTAAEVLAALFRRCAALADCNAAYPRLAADADSVMDRVRRAPLRVSIAARDGMPDRELLLDERMMKEGLAQLLIGRGLAISAPLLIHTLAHRGIDVMTPHAARFIELLSDDDIAYGTNLAFHCNDSAPTETVAWLRARCTAWIGAPYGDSTGAPLTSDIPSLVMVGEFDPRTPPSYAHALASGLTRAHVLTVPGHGHDLQHPCLSRIQRDFFAAPDRAPDTACVDSLPPLRFVTRVAPSRWIGSAVAQASTAPARIGGPLAAAFVLFVIPMIAAPVRRMRMRREGRRPELRREGLLLWLTAAVGITLLVAAPIAVFVGAQRALLLPMIGVPADWRWVLLLPWLLLVLAVATAITVLRRRDDGARRTLLSYSVLLGAALVLGTWVVLSL